MKSTKYKGGTILTTFRLPKEGYKSTRAMVNALLTDIAKGMNKDAETRTKSTVDSAKTTLIVKPQLCQVKYKCGCTVIDSLFRRQAGCSKAKVQH